VYPIKPFIMAKEISRKQSQPACKTISIFEL